MDPVSLLAVSAVAGGAAAGVGAFGQIGASKATASQLRYQAGVADLNEKIAKQNADFAIRQGQVEQQQYGMKARFQQGKIFTAQAASGLDVNVGTPSAVRDSATSVAQMDQRLIRDNAARKAWGYEVEAEKQKAEAGAKRVGANQSIRAGQIAAASSILGGVSSVSSKWMQANQLGITGGLGGGGGMVGPTTGDYYEA